MTFLSKDSPSTCLSEKSLVKLQLSAFLTRSSAKERFAVVGPWIADWLSLMVVSHHLHLSNQCDAFRQHSTLIFASIDGQLCAIYRYRTRTWGKSSPSSYSCTRDNNEYRYSFETLIRTTNNHYRLWLFSTFFTLTTSDTCLGWSPVWIRVDYHHGPTRWSTLVTRPLISASQCSWTRI